MDTTLFLQKVKEAITVPSFQPRFTNDNLLSIASDEQAMLIVSEIIGLRQDYFVKRTTGTVAPNSYIVNIPARASGRTLRDIKWQRQNDQSEYPLTHLKLEDIRTLSVVNSVDTPSGFTFVGDEVWLSQPVVNGGTCVLYYEDAPSALVATSRTATVTSVLTNTVTVQKVPTNITIGSYVDVTKNVPGYVTVYQDVLVTNISGNVITLDLTAVTDVSPGYSVSLAKETSIVQLFDEATLVLVQATAKRVVEALAVPDQLKIVSDRYMQNLRALRLLLAPRAQGKIQKVINRNNVLRNGVLPWRGTPRVVI